MEFFAVPLALVFLALWAGFTWMMVNLALAVVKDEPGRPLTQIVVAILVVGICWLIPNIPGLLHQRVFSKITTDCGWTVYKKGQPVDGIYADVTARSKTQGWYSNYLGYYGKVQHPTRIDEISEVSGGKYQVIPKRTLRYGIRLDRESVGYGAERYTQMVMDYDKDEVLAKYVMYDMTGRTNGWGVVRLAFDFLTAGPEGCKQRHDEFQNRLFEVLPAARAK